MNSLNQPKYSKIKMYRTVSGYPGSLWQYTRYGWYLGHVISDRSFILEKNFDDPLREIINEYFLFKALNADSFTSNIGDPFESAASVVNLAERFWQEVKLFFPGKIIEIESRKPSFHENGWCAVNLEILGQKGECRIATQITPGTDQFTNSEEFIDIVRHVFSGFYL